MAQISKRTTAEGENRYDVRMRVDGRLVTRTFKRRRDADSYAAKLESDRLRGVAIDPRRGQVTVREFGTRWIQQRNGLAERTRELYEWVFDHHIVPVLGDIELGKLTPSMVRDWYVAGAARRTS